MIDVSNAIPVEHNASFLKYLTFIQDVITRMNRNVFQLKGWCITIVAALSALAVNNGGLLLLWVAAFSTIPFCLLDAYYLLMERQFRGLYNDVVNGCPDISLFSMSIRRYTRVEAQSEREKYTYWRVVCSRSVLWFYGSMFFLCVVGWSVCRYWSLSSQKNCRLGAAAVDCSMPRYWELRGKDFESRKSGEESFRWEYKWK